MLFRPGADVRKISADGLPDLIQVLGEATGQWTAKLSAGHAVAKSVLHDAMLTSHCFLCTSAVAAAKGVEEPADEAAAIEGHMALIRETVFEKLHEDSHEPIDVDDTCVQLFAFLSDADAQAGNKAKRTRTIDTDWRATDQQSAVLNMLTHVTLDLAMGANTAMDGYDCMLLAAEDPEKSGVTEADVDVAELRAVHACLGTWASVKALAEMHTAFVMNHIADPTMKQVLWMSTMESITAVQSSLLAILRGELRLAVTVGL